MANEQNIIPHQFTSDQDREKAAKNGVLGGRASGAARRRKKSLKEAADLYLSMPVSDAKTRKSISKAGIDQEDIDNQMAIIVGLSMKAAKGDSKAAKVLFDILGDEEKDKETDTVNIIIDV